MSAPQGNEQQRVDVLAYISPERLTTPTRYKARQLELKAMRSHIRSEIAKTRELRRSVRLLDREEGDALAEWIGADTWPRYRRLQEWLRVMVPVKYSHVSPRAAAALANVGAAK